MRKPFLCTLTGADDRTNQDDLINLSTTYPFVEWAVLISDKRSGIVRYPTFDWIDSFLGAARPGTQISLHFCGRTVQSLLAGDRTLLSFAGASNRIQLNFNNRRTPVDLNEVESLALGLEKDVILQEHEGNGGINRRALGGWHNVLIDGSGGRGISPDSWPAILPGFICQGYAGGLSPDNLSVQLPRIAAAAGNDPYWIDMESSLRGDDDAFDLAKCRRVLDIVAAMPE